MSLSEFEGFPKIARLSRQIVITEKLDGTNAQIAITPEGDMYVGSRNRWLQPEGTGKKGSDNFGFAAWAHENRDDLMKLGPGRHFGEWWGRGVQRGYGLTERRFSLFNPRWADQGPECCSVVPVLYNGAFSTHAIDRAMLMLEVAGSVAAPGFMNPEGIIVYHTAARTLFKRTFEHDAEGKPTTT